MKKFKLVDLQSGVETDYWGEKVTSSAYRFQDAVGTSTLELKEDGGLVSMRRETPELILSAELRENTVAELDVFSKELDSHGTMPILVRAVKIDYPTQIDIVYQLIDEVGAPIQTCEVLVSEAM